MNYKREFLCSNMLFCLKIVLFISHFINNRNLFFAREMTHWASSDETHVPRSVVDPLVVEVILNWISLRVRNAVFVAFYTYLVSINFFFFFFYKKSSIILIIS